MCKVYIVLPYDTNPNIICDYASDNYFKIVCCEEDKQVIRNKIIYNVIPDTQYIGLGEQRGVEHSKNYYKSVECLDPYYKDIGLETIRKREAISLYDCLQWYLLIKELVWDYGLSSVGILCTSYHDRISIYTKMQISIQKLSQELLYQLPLNTLLYVISKRINTTI